MSKRIETSPNLIKCFLLHGHCVSYLNYCWSPIVMRCFRNWFRIEVRCSGLRINGMKKCEVDPTLVTKTKQKSKQLGIIEVVRDKTSDLWLKKFRMPFRNKMMTFISIFGRIFDEGKVVMNLTMVCVLELFVQFTVSVTCSFSHIRCCKSCPTRVTLSFCTRNILLIYSLLIVFVFNKCLQTVLQLHSQSFISRWDIVIEKILG